jgi:transcription initiation factor TFIIH subunit 2
VGVSAEVHILRRATEVTGGSYSVALNEAHLSELLLAHAPPPPAPPGQLTAELVRMGFPQRAGGDASSAVFCGELPVLAAGGYTCPRCRARTQELPCKSVPLS